MHSLILQPRGIVFPSEAEKSEVEWAPVYIEPMPGSGERLAIGVVVKNQSGALVAPVKSLNRLRCVYGEANDSLIYVAESGLASINEKFSNRKDNFVAEWNPPMEGLFLGKFRTAMGESLQQVADYALMLSSSLYEELPEAVEYAVVAPPPNPQTVDDARLERLIKERVVMKRPGLEQAFSKKFTYIPGARSTTIGFVGQRVAANFTLLNPARLKAKVERAKSKLWDLGQIKNHINAGLKGVDAGNYRYELLIYGVNSDDPHYSAAQIESVKEAAAELVYAADKEEIRCREFSSHSELADLIVTAEAA